MAACIHRSNGLVALSIFLLPVTLWRNSNTLPVEEVAYLRPVRTAIGFFAARDFAMIPAAFFALAVCFVIRLAAEAGFWPATDRCAALPGALLLGALLRTPLEACFFAPAFAVGLALGVAFAFGFDFEDEA
jgi:hypothetical protein